MLDGTGATYFWYDTLDRRIKRRNPGALCLYWSYDANGNRTRMVDPDGYFVYYQYDRQDRNVLMKDHDKGYGVCAWGTAPYGTPASYTYFRYDKAGRLTKQKNFNRTFAYHTWDPAGRESAIHHEKSNGDPLVTLDYKRDLNGNITKISRESGRTFYYEYDKTEQLLSETIKDSGLSTLYGFSYDYDGAGNRMHMVRNGENTYYDYNKANQILYSTKGAENTYFFFDGKGNTVRERQPDGFNRYYQYDADNMMTRVKYAESGDRTHYYFKYNALIERVQKIDWGIPGEEDRNYIFDGIDKVLVFDDFSAIERYVMGVSNVMNISGAIKFKDLIGNSTFNYHPNNLLSILGLSDNNQTMAQEYLYNAYGNIIETSGLLGEFQMLRYSQKEYDANSNQYNYLFRNYNPEIGRWENKDIISQVSSSFVFDEFHFDRDYLFCFNNPNSNIDPFGLNPVVVVVGGAIITIPIWVPIAVTLIAAAAIVTIAVNKVKPLPKTRWRRAKPRRICTPRPGSPENNNTIVELISEPGCGGKFAALNYCYCDCVDSVFPLIPPTAVNMTTFVVRIPSTAKYCMLDAAFVAGCLALNR